MELTVGGETLSPRERLVTVPYAVKSDVSESVNNLPDEVLGIGSKGTTTSLYTFSRDIYITEKTRNSFAFLIDLNVHHFQSQPVTAEITFGVSGENFLIEKKSVRKNGRHKLEAEINDVPPIGLGKVFIKVDQSSGTTHLYDHLILSRYKK